MDEAGARSEVVSDAAETNGVCRGESIAAVQTALQSCANHGGGGRGGGRGCRGGGGRGGGRANSPSCTEDPHAFPTGFTQVSQWYKNQRSLAQASQVVFKIFALDI